jgi:signal transduction histidine kinase
MTKKMTQTPAFPTQASHPASETLQQAEAYGLAKSMTDASIDGMLALDSQLRVIAWNQTAVLWTGIPETDVLGKTFFELFPTIDASGKLGKAFNQALLGRKSFLKATDTPYLPGYYEVHTVPLQTGPDVTGILIILHDVAHRIKAENQLKALNQQLAQQNAALQQAHEELAVFAKVAAHDLKEPLRKIYTFSELIMIHDAKKLSTSGRSNFRRIQKSVQRMGLLTDDLVNFTMLSFEGVSKPVDLGPLLTDILQEYKTELVQRETTFQLSRLPVLTGDPAALSHLLRQLIDNALKFCQPEGPVIVEIGYQYLEHLSFEHPAIEEGRPYHCLSVKDNGIGFDMTYQTRIFELFQRLHPDGAYVGSGMGLAIARKAMNLHGGFITVESTLGTGSTFYCYFPIRNAVLPE